MLRRNLFEDGVNLLLIQVLQISLNSYCWEYVSFRRRFFFIELWFNQFKPHEDESTFPVLTD